MRQDRALLTACCTDMSAGAFSAQVQAFQAINPVGFLVVNRPSLPAQLNMNTRATVAYPGFRYFPDTQGYRPIVTPALPVVNGSALHQQPASPPDADTISLQQKCHRLALLSRPQNFCFSTSCSNSAQRPASSAADSHPPVAAGIAVRSRPARQIFSSS